MAAQLQIPVSVIVERIKAESRWIDHIWQPREVLVGEPAAEPWTMLYGDDERASFYAGSTTIDLYRSDTGHYRYNLMGECKLWVVLTPTESDPPYELFKVTADPTEGEGQTEAGGNLVDTVPMPEAVRAALEDFVVKHHVEETFFKRKRDRADPEALGRRAPRDRDRDDG
jgi:hypothetical protein